MSFALLPRTSSLHCRQGARECNVGPQLHVPWTRPDAWQQQITTCMPNASSTTNRRSRLQVVCMAHPRRVAKVASQIQREISDMFITDEVLVRAVTPERATGLTELSAVASVTHVYVSNDLQVVKVYVSIYSDERGKQKAMNNLKRLEGYVRREMGQRVPLRLTPDYRFEYDDSIEEAELVERVIGAEDIERFTKQLEEEQEKRGNEQNWLQATNATSLTSAKADVKDDNDVGFFDADDIEEPEDDYPTTEAWSRNRPGPFDDLFGGPSLRQPRKQGTVSRKPSGGKRRNDNGEGDPE